MHIKEKQLLYAVEKYGVTIVVAETGSGKTTRTSAVILVICGYYSRFCTSKNYRNIFTKPDGLPTVISSLVLNLDELRPPA
jgi:hypothetical protein